MVDERMPATLRSIFPAPQIAVAFGSTADVLASAGDHRTIRLWDPARNKERLLLEGHEDDIYQLAFTPSGRTLVSGGSDGKILLWDVRTGQRTQTLPGHRSMVTALSIHPHGDDILSAANEIVLRRRKASIGPVGRTVEGDPGGTRFAAFAPGG